MKKNKYSVSIVGATGLVGGEMLRVLESRNFPVSDLRLFASENSVGERIEFCGQEYKVQVLNEKNIQTSPSNFVLFATSAELSAKFVPLAAKAGSICIDNSSHFRMDPKTPLIVPEVNPDKLEMAADSRIIANPNCSTIQLVVCLKALSRYGLKRVVVSTYQSVSGAGADALDELQSQISSLFSHGEVKKKVFPHQIAFNCIPHIDSFTANGFTKEEMKMINESRKILDLPTLRITSTAVRVPTLISHAESVNVEFAERVTAEQAKKLFSDFGIIVLDDPSKNLYPLGFEATGRDEVFVGRIRIDESVENGLHFWAVADNLRKGAATNAVQIAELCVEEGFTQ
ncbi:MAG: asd [Bacteriovoracaceae bacterium]|nr:asd [Bacteriovoracaceae bacterium]